MTTERPWRGRRLHFVGIGGSGMSGLALVSHRLGARVTGVDRVDGPNLARLGGAGIDVTVGHDAGRVPGDVELVVSSAVPDGNPERVAGRRLGLRELSRGHLLAELARLRRCIAVAGTHGKTTTSAMVVHALRGSGQQVSYVIGGDLLPGRTNADWRDGSWLVVEADESDRSLLELVPEVAVVTNVELDHVEEFASLDEVEDVFRRFLDRPAVAVVPTDPRVRALRAGPAATFDVPAPDLSPLGSQFDWRGHTVRVGVPGTHNARNAAAALEACRVAGADTGRAAAALADFPGVARRFELAGRTARGAAVYDDYAHHPSEVAATLAAARSLGPARIVAVLRPWGGARVEAMAEAFGAALADADQVIVLDVGGYDRSPDGRAVTSEGIVDAAAAAVPGRPVAAVPGGDEAVRRLQGELGPDTVCVAMGCGDVASGLVGEPAARHRRSVPEPALP